MRILVTGIIGQYPVAGVTLCYLQYVLGLRDLGHDVFYVEDNGTPPYNPVTQNVDIDYSYSLPYLAKAMESVGLGDRWAYMDYEHGFFGLPKPAVDELYRTADLWLNLSGATVLREEHMQIPRRAFVDTDPGFQQIAVAKGDADTIDFIGAHNVYLTYAENIGRPNCSVPGDHFAWQPCRQPVYLPLWTPDHRPDATTLTTVTNWSAYEPTEYNGETYGQKDIELRRFLDLPRRTSQPLELAIAAFEDVQALLREHGWIVTDPRDVTRDIPTFQEYIAQSRGEWSVAKNAYAKTWSGWVSERDANYLAAGKPVLSQDTGFSENIPATEGFVAFRTMEECLAGIEAINGDYAFHCRRAREIAEEYLSASVVLPPMLERCMA
ncbi:MAG TPA: hypothetical protein VGM51_06630 [Armatimonadota bacterium]|jgi:hypothetical protein